MQNASVVGLTSIWLLVALVAGVAAQPVEVNDRDYPFTPGARLELDLQAGGSAVITGWDRPLVRVSYVDEVADLDDHVIEIRERRGGLVITGEWTGRRSYSHSLNFEIRVPREVEIEFHSGGGGLELVNLNGMFEGKTAGGELTLRELDGEVQLKSGGGAIEIVDCRLDGRVGTGGGEVWMENVVGDVEATSGGGNVQYRNVRGHDGQLRSPGGHGRHDRELDGDITEETVLITTAGGGIDIREAPAGAKLSTGGGSIEVKSAERFVIAQTGGGDIQIRVGDAWVKATTGAGDIEVEVEEGLGDGEEGIELSTGTGDIYVEIPAGLSVELDLQIAYTRNSKRSYGIKSDIELELELSDEWDYDHGTPRKYIRGAGVVAGGQHRIRIGTVNGNIRLRTSE